MADDNNRDHSVFTAAKPHPIPRPKVWRVCGVQLGAGLLGVGVTSLWYPEQGKAVLVAVLITVLSQAYFTWRSMRHFGARVAGLFVVGTSRGLSGKWIIIALGLVLLWQTNPDLSAVTVLLTVLVLNTLAAALTPFLVK